MGRAARDGCPDAGCALIVNPPGHRTQERFHIHFKLYDGRGAALKAQMEAKLCGGMEANGSRDGADGGDDGWRRWHFVCKGQARFFEHFPEVFSVAMETGSIHHASIVAWPQSCDGRGTIILMNYGCSIEHSIL